MLWLICKRAIALIVDLGALDTTSLAISSRSLLLRVTLCWRGEILVESGGFLGFDRLTNDGIFILRLANHIEYLLLRLFFIPLLLKLYFCICRSLRWFWLLFSILFALNVHILRIVHVYFVELLLMLKTAIGTLEIVIKVVLLLVHLLILLLLLVFTGIWLFWIYQVSGGATPIIAQNPVLYHCGQICRKQLTARLSCRGQLLSPLRWLHHHHRTTIPLLNSETSVHHLALRFRLTVQSGARGALHKLLFSCLFGRGAAPHMARVPLAYGRFR